MIFLDKLGKVLEKLKEKNIRAELDDSSNTIGKKIREAELLKIPYMLIIGEREEKAKKVAIRQYGKGDLGSKSLEKFLQILK